MAVILAGNLHQPAVEFKYPVDLFSARFGKQVVLHMKADAHDITVPNNIVLSFKMKSSLITNGFLGSVLHEIIARKTLGF